MYQKFITCFIIVLTTIAVTKCFEGPSIGILSEEVVDAMQRAYPSYKSYIGASYVKAVQGSGGRVVPLLINKSTAYYRKKMANLNGVLLPGGACLFDYRYGYAAAGARIYAVAEELNKNGDYFPILGVCLGFELMVYLSNNSTDCRTRCKSPHSAMPLHFLDAYKDSQLFGEADNEIIDILETLPVTANHHRTCVTPTNFTATGLDRKWKTLSINNDDKGKTFISSIESIQYPFAAVQFHPEKNMYEWKRSQKNPHSKKAILAARYFYDWLISEASKNTHKFPSWKEKADQLIENYPIFYSAKKGLAYDEIYLFS